MKTLFIIFGFFVVTYGSPISSNITEEFLRKDAARILERIDLWLNRTEELAKNMSLVRETIPQVAKQLRARLEKNLLIDEVKENLRNDLLNGKNVAKCEILLNDKIDSHVNEVEQNTYKFFDQLFYYIETLPPSAKKDYLEMKAELQNNLEKHIKTCLENYYSFSCIIDRGYLGELRTYLLHINTEEGWLSEFITRTTKSAIDLVEQYLSEIVMEPVNDCVKSIF